MTFRCSCGGPLYTLAQLQAMPGGDTPEDERQLQEMWASLVGVMDFYCYMEDEVLTETEGWRAAGLWTPGHDAQASDWDPIEGWLW